MAPISQRALNRIGFAVAGLATQFGYVIMLSAAFDLLKIISDQDKEALNAANQAAVVAHRNLTAYTAKHQQTSFSNNTNLAQDNNNSNSNNNINSNATEYQNVAYCNEKSTSAILLADTLPALLIKFLYPFIFFNLPVAFKVLATVTFSLCSYLTIGLSLSELGIFSGVVFASLAVGFGEPTFLSITPQHSHNESLSGWSIGSGLAGVLSSLAYVLLTIVFKVRVIMLSMLVLPVSMAYAYFCIIKPIPGSDLESFVGQDEKDGDQKRNSCAGNYSDCEDLDLDRRCHSLSYGANAEVLSTMKDNDNSNLHLSYQQLEGHLLAAATANRDKTTKKKQNKLITTTSGYGSVDTDVSEISARPELIVVSSKRRASTPNQPLVATKKTTTKQKLSFADKLRIIPSLAKYFVPLFIVYVTEYFINHGLYELVYYPEITFLGHAEQYRWFQVAYRVGVMFSRSSIELIQLPWIWFMAVLQILNMIIFILHATLIIQVPNFYLMLVIIFYEGLLSGFSYVNTFYRITKEVSGAERREFAISTVSMADSLGISVAGLISLPVHEQICKLYD